MTIISIVAKGNWPISNLISFLEKLQKALIDAHPVLTTNEIYDLEMSKAMLEHSNYFFPEGKGDITVFSKDYIHDSLVRDRFRSDVDLLLAQYRQSVNNTFTIEEFITYNRMVSFEKRLKNRISEIEKKVVDYEETVKRDKEHEILRIKKAKDALDAIKKKDNEARFAIEKKRRYDIERKRQEEDAYVSEFRSYYKRCRYYIDNGYDGYSTDELEIDDECLTPEEIKETIIKAHIKKNDDLVKYHTFPGCHDHGIDCNCGVDCTWEVDDHRCSCGNYKGFEFNVDDVDWETDITLDSTNFRGRQERQW
ncbi:MAG: hypothetical protein PHG66_02050 [Candidatus Colwellbacteria bacterium]|nr:hypothetical protein [Candidatus Colwellbacteria bacterium]